MPGERGEGDSCSGSSSTTGCATSSLPSAEVRKGQPEQPMPFGSGSSVRSNLKPMSRNASRPASGRSRCGAGDDLEILIFYLQSNRPPADLPVLDAFPDGMADAVELGQQGRLPRSDPRRRCPRRRSICTAGRADLAVADGAGEVEIISRCARRNGGEPFEVGRWRSAPVSMPSPAIFSAACGPTPWKRRTGSDGDEAAPSAGGITHRPSGLFWSLSELGEELVVGRRRWR